MFIKKKLKQILFNKGYKISKISNHALQNENPFLGCKSKISDQQPIVFDIGMNHGQTLNKILKVYPNAHIHGFEASKYCYSSLLDNFSDNANIILNNTGMSDKDGTLEFNEYSWDAMNSFLTRAYGKAKIVDTYNVNVTSVDTYCKKQGINYIHILKSDTEGFELKVLEGAKNMMKQNKIQFVFVELFFDVNFHDQASVGEIFSYLESQNFSLVRFYDFGLTGDGVATRSDALFMNLNFKHD